MLCRKYLDLLDLRWYLYLLSDDNKLTEGIELCYNDILATNNFLAIDQ